MLLAVYLARAQVIAVTYHQVWWPSTDTVRFDGDQLPKWHGATALYIDSDTGELLPSWDEALDAIGLDDEPAHGHGNGMTRHEHQRPGSQNDR